MADAERQPDPRPAEAPAPPAPGAQTAATNPYRVPDGGWPAATPQPPAGQAPAQNGQAWSPQAWPAPQPGQPYAYGYASPYAGQPYGYYGQAPYAYAQRPRVEPKVQLAFISLLIAYFVVPIAPALLALKLAGDARTRILASQGTLTGLGMVSAARWLSVLHMVMVIGGSTLFGTLLSPLGLLL